MKAKWTALVVSGFVLLLSGCVVVPAYPGYASGPVYVGPPAVFVRGYWGSGYRQRGW
jgi:hypothetical protein